MVEGLARRKNVSKHGVDIFEYVAGRYAERPIPLIHEPFVACFVTCRIASHRMSFAIYLDCHPC